MLFPKLVFVFLSKSQVFKIEPQEKNTFIIPIIIYINKNPSSINKKWKLIKSQKHIDEKENNNNLLIYH